MSKTKKIILISVIVVVLIIAISFGTFVFFHGYTKPYSVPEDVHSAIVNQKEEKEEDSVRIMSSNLLVYYDSWGGEDARPRAKMYFELEDTYKPDVIAIQEMCDMWYQCFMQHKGPYKLLFPFSTGAMVRFTSLAYNSDTTTLIDKGQIKYEQGDNPRLRRVVWGLFEDNATKKRYIVTSTHLDLIRQGKEQEELDTMNSQAKELINLSNELKEKYNVPVFSCGDYNTVNNIENWRELYPDYTDEELDEFDVEQIKTNNAPSVYDYLCENLTDTKLEAKKYNFASSTNVNSPAYDHIFMNGDADILNYSSISDEAMYKMSDHFSIYIDARL